MKFLECASDQVIEVNPAHLFWMLPQANNPWQDSGGLWAAFDGVIGPREIEYVQVLPYAERQGRAEKSRDSWRLFLREGDQYWELREVEAE